MSLRWTESLIAGIFPLGSGFETTRAGRGAAHADVKQISPTHAAADLSKPSRFISVG
jgi:hypothetical protein